MESLSFPPYPPHWRVPTPRPWREFLSEFLAQYEPPLRASKTLSAMRLVVRQVTPLLGDEPTTAGLRPELVARFIASQPATISVNTKNSRLRALRAMCGYAEAMGYLDVNPFRLRKFFLRPGPPKEKRHFSREEIARVLAQAAHEVTLKKGWAQWRARRSEALIALIAYTGMRKMEALCLKLEDVDLQNRVIMLKGNEFRQLKTPASGQPIPIPAALAPILADWMPRTLSPLLFPSSTNETPWTGGTTSHKPLGRLRAIAKRAGVVGITFHSLRHSWATHAEFWGLSDTMIQRVLRHTTVQTQQIYRHADLINMREKTDGISFGPTPGEVRRGG